MASCCFVVAFVFVFIVEFDVDTIDCEIDIVCFVLEGDEKLAFVVVIVAKLLDLDGVVKFTLLLKLASFSCVVVLTELAKAPLVNTALHRQDKTASF